MRIAKRKWYRTYGLTICQSFYHDKRYILIHLGTIAYEIELRNTYDNGKEEIEFRIKYDKWDKARHFAFRRRHKTILL